MSRAAALAALLLFACPAAFADASAVARLGELLGAMRRVDATFVQVLRDERGEVLQESRGTVRLAHPGRFRWQTEAPFEQLVVSDGTTLWQYDPDLAQVLIRPLDRRADQVPSLLLSGEVEAVQSLYDIAAGRDDAGAERFELVPKAGDGPFERLALQFRDGRIERLEITDGLGQRTEVGFESVRESAAAAEADFRFETPEGVDEVRDE